MDETGVEVKPGAAQSIVSIRNPVADRVVEWAVRLILGGVFLYAGALKIWDPGAFFADVENYRVVSGGMAAAVAFYLPWIEVAAAAAVLTRWQYRGGTILILSLSLLFFAMLSLAWARGLDISCGCFGASGEAVNYPLALARATGLAAGAGLLLFLDRKRK